MKRFVFSPRSLTLGALLAVLATVGLSSAWAGSSVGTQFAETPVRTTLTLSGNILTVSATSVNKSSAATPVYIEVGLYWPNGAYSKYWSGEPTLSPGQSYTVKQSFDISRGGFPAGQYQAFGSASLGNNPCHRSESSVTMNLP